MYSTRYSTYQSSPYYSTSYNYQASPTTPTGGYYYTTYNPSPKSKHKRRATADGYAYASPQGYYYPQEESKPKRHSSHRHEHVSGHRRTKTKTTYVYPDTTGTHQYRSGDAYYTYPSKSTHQAYTGRHADSRGADYGNAYEQKYRTSPPPPDDRQQYYGDRANAYSYRQTAYEQPQPETRPRRSASYSTKQAPPRRSDPVTPKRAATEADCRRHDIPAGFSTKHWDPSEEPILLLGSVFDAYTLGKWIYDWTVATHGSGAPLTEVAGDLWLLLIDLSGKIKRAEEKQPRIGNSEDKELIDDFLESGERLWQRFSKLLKICETYMLKTAKKSSSRKIVVGKNSGVEFVKCIFGRDKELEKTEKIMTGIRLWSMRFDANCDEILRYA